MFTVPRRQPVWVIEQVNLGECMTEGLEEDKARENKEIGREIKKRKSDRKRQWKKILKREIKTKRDIEKDKWTEQEDGNDILLQREREKELKERERCKNTV